MKIFLFALALLIWPFTAAQSSDASKFRFRIDEVKFSQKSLQGIQFVAVNNNPIPVTLSFNLTGNGFTVDKNMPVTLVVAPYSTQEIARITKESQLQPFSFSPHHTYQVGDAFMPPYRNARYILPFAVGTPFLVVQGPAHMSQPGTLVTHNNDYSRYAFDFGVPEGTPVTAAREGTVIEIKDNFTAGRPDSSYSNKANYMAIMHDDNSIAYYFHLAPRGVHATIGQRVQAGELIAYSGNTGFTYGPHLHFDVRRAAISEKGEVVQMSVPVDFQRRDWTAGKIILEEGMLLKAQ